MKESQIFYYNIFNLSIKNIDLFYFPSGTACVHVIGA